ncbi:cupin domain-containing protein [Aquincola sp. S2]|uniref:Cupin domain-containing protein n=1 Tax=Pseudaquabacterium terrae TaxID=2732868 RepID=A0ABX2EGG7_9BURK|nr:cupin domain-containing protein [Aquabacterium terrae]NRF67727.1 cupin domain-containing protein [Aquabacterium terrae]
MQVRRVVTGVGPEGRGGVVSDGPAPRSAVYDSVPGFASALIWSTAAEGRVGAGTPKDDTPQVSFVPGPGQTRLMFVTFPPDAVMMRPEFDGAAFGAEFAKNAPGLAETFEMEHPGMHTTDSIDYDVVLDGEIVLELDDGREVILRRHDVVVQHGTRHAWRNRSARPATMLFVLMGTRRG